ncbi:MAG: trigger factor [Anaerolineae bacterium]|nr:trigger factor [Anaerolineae bacterium]
MFEVNKELLESHEALLNVVFEEEAVDGAKRRAARKISLEVNIPGFRKGKAPYTKVVQWVGEPAVIQEAAELLLDESYSDILEKAEVSPYASGEFVDMKTDPLTFKIRVPLEPQVNLGDYMSLREDWEAPSVSDEEVEQVLAQMREENAILEPVERAAEMGDQLTVDVKATVVGDTIVEEDDIEVRLSEERPFLSPEFVAALVGLSANEESAFDLTLPETIDEPSLRGVDAAFTVHVNTVYERKLPELDDALASTVGSFETLDELKQDIVDRIMAQKQQQAGQAYRDRLVEKLMDQAEFEYPPQMVEETVDEMVHETEHRVERQSQMSFEDALRLEGRTLDQFRDEIKPQAEQRVKRSLALRQFALQEGIAVEDDEVVREYMTFMSQFGPGQQLSADDVKLDSPLAQSFRNSVFGRKVLDRLAAIGRGQADIEIAEEDADVEAAQPPPVAEGAPEAEDVPATASEVADTDA